MNDYLEELNIDVFRERLLEELEVFLDKNNTNGFIKDETIYYFVSSLVDYIYYEVKAVDWRAKLIHFSGYWQVKLTHLFCYSPSFGSENLTGVINGNSNEDPPPRISRRPQHPLSQ